MRALAIVTTLLLATTLAFAADPKVEAAIKVFQTVAADANKMKTFCEMMKLDEQLETKEDPAIEAQIVKLAAQIGADFKAAWDLAESTDDDSPDGKLLNAAVDLLTAKCPK
jgi:hypothetical protein